jgi:tRNA A37 threonylcarbamoyladenosine synthetase subunit TsaC/SUA5/YrdC
MTTLASVTSRHWSTIDWSTTALDMSAARDLDRAAEAIVQGAIACHPFANFYVFSARPNEEVVRYVNVVKGRSPEQTGSVVTTADRLAPLFDWTRLPAGLDADLMLEFIQALLELGPLGFRGPAAVHLPDHLTADDNGVRTVQVVNAGHACPSNELYARVMERIPEGFMYGTSGNRSRRQTGADEEPVHHRLQPLQAHFGSVPRFLMLRSPDEQEMLRNYPLHDPMSATLLSFHKLAPTDRSRPRLVVERHGSLRFSDLREVAAHFELDLHMAPAAQQRLTRHFYPDESDRAA